MNDLLKKMEMFTQCQGKIVRWLIFPLIFVLCYEITARYLFNSPTIWAYDLTYFFYGSLYMLGGAYTLMADQHVRIEFLYMKFSPKTKNIVEICGYLVFFFPVVIAYLIYGFHFAGDSFLLQERAKESIFAPIIWPYKAIIPLTAFFLLLQGACNFIRRIIDLKGGHSNA